MKQITKKQKGFANRLLTDPKTSATQAAFDVYRVKNRHVAEQIAHENLRKPVVLQYMNQFADKAERRIIELTKSGNERIALDASKDVLDRSYGKATQRLQVESHSARINIDLTGRDEPTPG